jgi:hypothetical protein
MSVPTNQLCNIQLGNAIRTNNAFANKTNLALPAGQRYVFVQYEPRFLRSDLSLSLLRSDISEWIYRMGTMVSGYRHVRCVVVSPPSQPNGAWQGKVWDLDDSGPGTKKTAQRASQWAYNDPDRNNGLSSGYVFYGTTNLRDEQISAIAAQYVSSRPVYTLTDNNCCKFAHYLAGSIADSHGTSVVYRVQNHYAAKVSVFSKKTQSMQIVQGIVS